MHGSRGLLKASALEDYIETHGLLCKSLEKVSRGDFSYNTPNIIWQQPQESILRCFPGYPCRVSVIECIVCLTAPFRYGPMTLIKAFHKVSVKLGNSMLDLLHRVQDHSNFFALQTVCDPAQCFRY